MDLEMLERKQTLLMLSNPFSPLILLAFMQVGIAQVSLDEHGKFDPLELSDWYQVKLSPQPPTQVSITDTNSQVFPKCCWSHRPLGTMVRKNRELSHLRP